MCSVVSNKYGEYNKRTFQILIGKRVNLGNWSQKIFKEENSQKNKVLKAPNCLLFGHQSAAPTSSQSVVSRK